MAEQAAWAERYGWDSVVVGEHHSLDEYLPNPLMAAMYIAARTNRIRVGSYIALAPLYNPIRLAEDAAMLDLFSGGRLFLALGAGYQPLDFSVFGIPLSQRVSRLEECVEILRRAFSGERFSYEGRRYVVRDFALEPKPLQKPRPRIYLGAWSEGGARRAGRLGDGLALAPATRMAPQRRFIELYEEEARRAGKEPHVVVCRDGWVSRDRDAAASEAGRYILSTFIYYWSGGGILDLPQAFYRPDGSPDLSKKGEITIDIMAEDRWVFGSVDDAISFIEMVEKQYRAEELLMVFQQTDGNPPQRDVLNQIRLWGERIIPYFKDSARGT